MERWLPWLEEHDLQFFLSAFFAVLMLGLWGV